MNFSNKNLVWIDLEMTGLSVEEDLILEIATVVTDEDLNIIGNGPVFAISQSLIRLDQMDAWNTDTHTKSGLVRRVLESKTDEKQAEQETLDFIAQYIPKNKSPLCGNSICQDRRFLAKHMPKLENFLHYRNLDVTTIKELAMRWNTEVGLGFKKQYRHEALSDIHESIEELRYFREHFLKL